MGVVILRMAIENCSYALKIPSFPHDPATQNIGLACTQVTAFTGPSRDGNIQLSRRTPLNVAWLKRPRTSPPTSVLVLGWIRLIVGNGLAG